MVTGRGLSMREVARRHGVTPTAVRYCLRGAGVAPQPTVRYATMIPWKVRVAHNNATIVRRLRKLARMQAGEQLPEETEKAIKGWVQWLVDNQFVVIYDSEGGFGYAMRTPADGSALVRP